MNDTKRSAVTELRAFSLSTKKTDKRLVEKRDFYSLSYRYSGKVLIESGGESMYSEEGSITFVPKGVSYATEIVEDMRMIVLHFRLHEDIDFRNATVMKINDVGIRMLFEKLASISRTDSSTDFGSMSVFYELLSRLDEHSKKKNEKQIPDKIARAKARIERRYFDSSLSIESLADELKISTSYLRREFSRAYGLSPVAFLTSARISHAKNMLESGFLSISEIAEQSGFSSTSYFIQVFHKTVGLSPDKYRRSLSPAEK